MEDSNLYGKTYGLRAIAAQLARLPGAPKKIDLRMENLCF